MRYYALLESHQHLSLQIVQTVLTVLTFDATKSCRDQMEWGHIICVFPSNSHNLWYALALSWYGLGLNDTKGGLIRSVSMNAFLYVSPVIDSQVRLGL